MRPASSRHQNQTKMSQKNYRSISLINIDAKTSNINKQNSTIHYKDHTPRPSGISREMQGFFNIHKSVNVINHINKLKNKNHMIISIDTEKAFDKIQHPFMIKKKKKTP